MMRGPGGRTVGRRDAVHDAVLAAVQRCLGGLDGLGQGRDLQISRVDKCECY